MSTNKTAIANWIAECPNVLVMRELWDVLRASGALGAAQPKTVALWEEIVLSMAYWWMDQTPADALWIYNTLLTIFDAPSNKLLFGYAQLKYTNALRAQRPAP